MTKSKRDYKDTLPNLEGKIQSEKKLVYWNDVTLSLRSQMSNLSNQCHLSRVLKSNLVSKIKIKAFSKTKILPKKPVKIRDFFFSVMSFDLVAPDWVNGQ